MAATKERLLSVTEQLTSTAQTHGWAEDEYLGNPGHEVAVNVYRTARQEHEEAIRRALRNGHDPEWIARHSSISRDAIVRIQSDA